MKEQYIFVSTYCGSGQEKVEKNYARLVSIEPSDVRDYIFNGAGKLGLLKNRKCTEITLKEASITYSNPEEKYHGHAEILNKQYDKVCIVIDIDTKGNISVQQAPGELFSDIVAAGISNADMLSVTQENKNTISYIDEETGLFFRIINLS